jgi:glycosyltransferase involved in cell wall biosynthesis
VARRGPLRHSRPGRGGLALLEALAAGLVVLAPGSGGPATYVEDGVTGVLVDTADPRSVGRGWHRALELAAGRPPALPTAERVSRARDLVDREFTVQAMARTLTGVYTGASTPVAR